MSPLQNWKTFVKAGDAIFTVENENTGQRLTFRVQKHAQKDLWFVKVLAGPDNEHDYGPSQNQQAVSARTRRWPGDIFRELEIDIGNRDIIIRSGCGVIRTVIPQWLQADRQVSRYGRVSTTPEEATGGFF